MLPTKFQINWPFGSGEEAKTRFSRWPPRQPSWIFRLGFLIWTFLAIFDLQVTLMLPTESQANWLFSSEEEVKTGFQDGLGGQRNNFSYFWSTSHPDTFYRVSSQLAHQFSRSKKIFFSKMVATEAILDFNQNDFSYFWSTSHLMLPTKFQVSWPFRSGEKANRFSR